MSFEIHHSVCFFPKKKKKQRGKHIILLFDNSVTLIVHSGVLSWNIKMTSYMNNKWSYMIMDALKYFLDLCYWLTNYSQEKMRCNTFKYALLTFLLTPLFPAKILFLQLYFVIDAHTVWSCSNKEIEKHPDWFFSFNIIIDPWEFVK